MSNACAPVRRKCLPEFAQLPSLRVLSRFFTMSHQPYDSANVPTPDWDKLAAKPEFQSLLARKKAFIVPALVFFMLFYLALPVLVGYWPDLMKQKVWGEVNIAYVFALSQFFMSWIMAWLYVRVASKWDQSAAEVIRDQA